MTAPEFLVSVCWVCHEKYQRAAGLASSEDTLLGLQVAVLRPPLHMVVSLCRQLHISFCVLISSSKDTSGLGPHPKDPILT